MYNYTCLFCQNQFKNKNKNSKYCSKMCYFHFERLYSTKLDRMRNKYEELVVINDSDNCYGWKGEISKNNRAITYLGNATINLSRAAWLLYNGPISNDLFVLHKCDNKICSRLDHLFLGSQKDNMLDMIKKGRKIINKGSKVKSSKLSEYQVQKIKILLHQNNHPKEIVKNFNVSLTTIYDIKMGRTWNHVTI